MPQPHAAPTERSSALPASGGLGHRLQQDFEALDATHQQVIQLGTAMVGRL